MYIILTFGSTHQALRAEHALLAAGLSHEVLPTPRKITVSCGLSLRVPAEHLVQLQSLVSAGHIEVKAAYIEPKIKGEPYYPLHLERS